MKSSQVLFSYDNGVAQFTLNQPDRLNSINDQMHGLINEGLDLVENDPALRLIVFTGAGRAFCAGQDQTDRQPLPDGEKRDLGQSLVRYYAPLLRRLHTLPVPVVCAMNGVAAGVGISIVLMCDIVIAKQSAYFTPGFSKLGLMPDGGLTKLLPQSVGTARALAMFMLNERISAAQAVEYGMIWRCVEDDAFEAECKKLILQLANSATKSLGMTKQAIYAAANNMMEQQLDLEATLQRTLGYTEDYQEGIASFREKRTAVFKGN